MNTPVPYIDSSAIQFFITNEEVQGLKIDRARNRWYICEVLRDVYMYAEKAKRDPSNLILCMDMIQQRTREATVMAKKMNSELLEWREYRERWENTPLKVE